MGYLTTAHLSMVEALGALTRGCLVDHISIANVVSPVCVEKVDDFSEVFNLDFSLQNQEEGC